MSGGMINLSTDRANITLCRPLLPPHLRIFECIGFVSTFTASSALMRLSVSIGLHASRDSKTYADACAVAMSVGYQVILLRLVKLNSGIRRRKHLGMLRPADAGHSISTPQVIEL